jgi:3-oxoadipate enol-lactonase
VLMLPGGSHRPDNFFQLIADLADDFRIIAPAYPPVFPLRSVLRGVGAVLDAAGLRQVTVFGCSYGGYVAQAMTKAMPERVDDLVLAQTGTRHFAGLPTMRAFAALFAALPLRLIRAFTWRLWMRWFTAPPESERFWRPRLRTELAEMTRAQHLAGVRNIVDFMATCSPAPGWLAPWDGRVLVLEATDDQAFSAEQRAELRRAYPQATVRALEAGHTALFTHPELFTTEIRGFLRADRAAR